MTEPYPPPMIDARYLRRANGTASEKDLREIAELEARLKAGGSYYEMGDDEELTFDLRRPYTP